MEYSGEATTEVLLAGLAAVIGLGIGAQWLAWRLRMPSILFLLVVGFVAGPITGWIDPEQIFGDLLFPLVSVSVALILFEGGLSLKVGELDQIARAVRNLILVGIPVTWVLVTGAAAMILGFDWELAALFGAILVVTGPTVVLPLLRFLRPVGRVGSIVKWEGILNDPVGATFAVLVFESIISGDGDIFSLQTLLGILKTLLVGGALGAATTYVLVFLLKRYWIPDFLEAAVTLMTVVVAFALSNHLQQESGLLTVTLMGILLANQKSVTVKHIVDFKENLRVLLISCLFIILSSRLDLTVLDDFDLSSFLFLAVLILVVRPVAVALSTVGAGLTWQERLFVSWMAPRGIVAAAVASLFGLRLLAMSEAPDGIALAGVDQLVPMTFLVIIGTISVYGLTAYPLARWTQLAKSKPQGVLIVGAHLWARKIAEVLQKEEIPVVVADTNRSNVNAARMDGLQTYFGSVLTESAMEELNLEGIGRLLALTANDEANSLAALHFVEVFDRSEVYQLAVGGEEVGKDEGSPRHLRGRLLFGKGRTYEHLTDCYFHGAMVKATRLSDEFDFAAFESRYGDKAVPLFVINEKKELKVFTIDASIKPEPGQRLISLVLPVENSGAVSGDPTSPSDDA